MQFVRHGPDIPERLLQAHEDGRVVFFCGAGISYPAGLPGFGGLVESLQSLVGEPPDGVEIDLMSKNQFDQVIGHYERRIQGGRASVRKQLPVALKSDLGLRGALTTHFALLKLGHSRSGLRLVTTNFDTLFEHAARHYGVADFTTYPDPPARSSWNGLVYLHGRMPSTPSDDELERLVLSDGDFGQAYLTQGWAARFVATLFRDFTLCFVGYSIDDPVLRYMTAAHALDVRGQEMFAFAPFADDDAQVAAQAWRAKNVTPVLYESTQSHRRLHQTLHVWSSIYRDGVRGKERIVGRYARRDPKVASVQNDYVGRLLWALSDPGGLPAKRFADFDPVPSLDWLEPLSEERYRHTDLARFGVPPRTRMDDELTFSLTRRPAPYPLAPSMCFVDAGARGSRWDKVMGHLARWMIRHLDDPALLLWLVKRGGQLHDDLVWWIEHRLDELAKLECDGKTAELARIRANAPKAIPGPLMRTLWRLLLTGRVKSWRRDFDLYRWRDRFKRDGLTATLRLELREILTPRVSLREPFRWPYADGESHEPERIKDLVDWEIVLSTDHAHSSLRDLPKDERWTAALPDLLSDVSALLRDALDLMRELGSADDRNDMSYMHQSSISEHPQNRDFRDWTVMIDLTRDAWLAMAAQSPERAALVAESWWHTPYPLFRRLIFFAATQDGVIPLRQALDWLLADDHWWLWSVETKRETMRLLVALAPQLNQAMLRELELAILAGPPRVMFKDDIEPEDWTEIVDQEVWLRLAKIVDAGAVLGVAGQERLNALSAQNPEWTLAADQRDEFPFWMESGWVGDRDPWRKFISIPRSRRGVLNYLVENPVLAEPNQDDWRTRCGESFQATAYALCHLAKQNVWPSERWRDALQAWSEEKLQSRSWFYMGPLLASAPDDLLESISGSVSWWLQAIAKTYEGHEAHFFTLVRRILALDHQGVTDADDPVGRAINHPVGHVTDALLHWWYRRTLEDGQGLAEELKPIFTELCDTRIDKFRHGRVLLATHVIALFRVDQDWATQQLLPIFDWHHSETEARAAWEGFLWSPRLYRPLMEVLKPAFLDTARHYAALGKHDGQYASLLTFAALDPSDTFTIAELAGATRSMPPDALHDTAHALVIALKGAGDQRANYWTNCISPYLQSIWPKTREKVTPRIAESFSRLCVAAQEAFPDAVERLRPWLSYPPQAWHLVGQLNEAGFCGKYPESALDFLDHILGDHSQFQKEDLDSCLKAIRDANPPLETDHRFQRLYALSR